MANQPKQLPLVEFIPLMALITALDALSIDSLMPAFPAITRDLAISNANDIQLVVSAMFFGFALGQMLGGPPSDSFGRRPLVAIGLALYMLGSLIGMFANSFPVLLAARVMQGAGAAVPFVVMTALVRDLYEGAPMARIMSFIGTVFILVPILAPLGGQGILLIASWRMIFLLYFGLAVLSMAWFMLRQPETLPPEKRIGLSLYAIVGSIVGILRNGVTSGYIIANALLLGAFLGYLNSAQQIFQDTYQLGLAFVLAFSSLAFSIGLALLINGTLVERFGMQRMTYLAFGGLAAVAILFLPVAWAANGVPPLWMTMLYLSVSFLCVGVLFGNLTSLAMEPLGAVAGVGAAVVQFVQTLLGLPIGILIGRSYNGTILPLVMGFAVCGSVALAVMRWAEAQRRHQLPGGAA